MKTLLVAVIVLIGVSARSQVVQSFPHVPETDTLVNADTVYKVFPIIGTKDKLFAIQPVVTKVSGTMAGTSFLQASLDGTNWVSVDSLTVTDVSVNTKLISIEDPKYAYYRFLFRTSGTVKAVPRLYYWLRNK